MKMGISMWSAVKRSYPFIASLQNVFDPLLLINGKQTILEVHNEEVKGQKLDMKIKRKKSNGTSVAIVVFHPTMIEKNAT